MNATASDTEALRRLFGVVVDPQTYRNAAYLLLTFPLGLLYFTAIVSGGAAGVGTLPLLVGIPILVGVLAVVVHLAELEARLANGLLGTDVAYGAARPRNERLVPYLKRLVLDPRSYLATGYLLSKFAIGVAAFTALVTLASLSLSFAFAPLLYDLHWIDYQFGAWRPATLPEALGLAVIGVALGLATLHVVNLAAWLVGQYTEVMLGSGEPSPVEEAGRHAPADPRRADGDRSEPEADRRE